VSLRSAVERDLASGQGTNNRSVSAPPISYEGIRELRASYGSDGAKFKGAGFEFGVGRGSVGRGGSTQAIGPKFLYGTRGGTYGEGKVTESFRLTKAGIEQSFEVASHMSGLGPLVIDVPVTGLHAVTDGLAVDLRDSNGHIRATYSGLDVTDASGKRVPATMRAGPHGDSILIEIDDAGARYPLNVDPMWSDDLSQSEVAITSTFAGNGTSGQLAGNGTSAELSYPYAATEVTSSYINSGDPTMLALVANPAACNKHPWSGGCYDLAEIDLTNGEVSFHCGYGTSCGALIFSCGPELCGDTWAIASDGTSLYFAYSPPSEWGGSSEVCSVDLSSLDLTGAPTDTCIWTDPNNSPVLSMAAAPDGTIYVTDSHGYQDTVYGLTSSGTQVFSANLPSGDNSGITADANYIWSDSDTTLFETSLTTGVTSSVATLPSFVTAGLVTMTQSAGELYLATLSSVLCYDESTGIFSPLAGANINGYAEGIGPAAEFNAIEGLSVYNGTVYVDDSSNNRIRELVGATAPPVSNPYATVSVSGPTPAEVSTFAGSRSDSTNSAGTGSSAGLDYPNGETLVSSSYLNGGDPTLVVTTSSASPNGGLAAVDVATRQVSFPCTGNSCGYQGGDSDLIVTDGQFIYFGVNSSCGWTSCSAVYREAISQLSSPGYHPDNIWGDNNASMMAMAVAPDGALYVAVVSWASGYPSYIYELDGTSTSSFPTSTLVATTTGMPLAMAVDNNYIWYATTSGAIYQCAGGVSNEVQSFPWGDVATSMVASGGYLYLIGDDQVWQYDEATQALVSIAGTDSFGYADGTGTAAIFNMPEGIVAYGSNLFVADTFNDTIREIFPPGFYPQGSPYGRDARTKSEDCDCGPAAPHSKRGDPVDTASGDLYETTTDISLPGAGIPLSFTRTYDADTAQSEAAAGQPASPLGYGWSSNLSMNVAYDPTAQIATVTEENGAQTTFAPYESGTSPSWCTETTDFCATAPRVDATLNQNPDGTWTYVRTVGGSTTFSFTSTGVLYEVADATGDTLSSSTYSPSGSQPTCPNDESCVAWTSSASGRELVEEFGSTGQLSAVIDPT
jgi:hypothetical protein